MTANGLIQRLPRHLKMGELRVFVAVLEHRSFRKAAAVLHLTQPAVTKAIAGLEDTLGYKLFDRVANGVEPTVHGRSFAPRAIGHLRRAAPRGTGSDAAVQRRRGQPARGHPCRCRPSPSCRWR